MKDIFQTNRFKGNLKLAGKRGKDLEKLKQAVRSISKGGTLEERYRDHALGGKWAGSRDCHVEPDWILISRTDGESLCLERAGSHSELFR